MLLKESMVIYTIGVGTLDWSSEPIQCALCEKKYDYINLHLNDNSAHKTYLLSSDYQIIKLTQRAQG